MQTSTWIALTGIMSAVSSFIQIYLFIRTYMSALVDMIQDYNKPPGKMLVKKKRENHSDCPASARRSLDIPPDLYIR